MLAGLFGGLVLAKQANCRPVLRARQVTGPMTPSKKHPSDAKVYRFGCQGPWIPYPDA